MQQTYLNQYIVSIRARLVRRTLRKEARGTPPGVQRDRCSAELDSSRRPPISTMAQFKGALTSGLGRTAHPDDGPALQARFTSQFDTHR